VHGTQQSVWIQRFGDPLKQLNETIEKIVEKFEVKQEEIDRFETLFQDSSLNAKLSKYERDTLEEEESQWKALYNYCIEHGMEIDGNISLEHLTRIASRVEEKEVEQLEMMDIDMDDLDDMDEEEEDLGVDEDDDIEEDEEMPMEKDNDTSMIATTDNKNNKNKNNNKSNKSNNKNNNREILYAKNQNITVQLVVDGNNNDGGVGAVGAGVGGVGAVGDHTGNKNNHCYSDKIIIVRTLVNGEFLADYVIANDAFFVQYMGYTRYRTAVDRMLKVMRELESVFSILTGPFIIEISHGPIVRYACRHALIGSTQQNMKLVKRDVLDLIYHFNYTEFSVRDGSLSLEKTEKIHRLIQWKPPISPSPSTTTTSSTLLSLSSQHNPNTAASTAAATISNSNNNNNDNSDNNDNNNSRRRSSTSSTSSSSSSIGNDTEIHLNNDKGNQLFHLAFLSIQFNDNGKKKKNNNNINKKDSWMELYGLTIRS
jgi:hypothetical protein